MTLFLQSGLQSSMLVAASGSITTAELSEQLATSLSGYEVSGDQGALLLGTSHILTEAQRLHLDDSWDRGRRAILSHGLAELGRQLQSFSVPGETSDDQRALLFRGAEQVVDILRPDHTAAPSESPITETDWEEVANGYQRVIDSDVFQTGNFPLIHGLGQIGLALGARMALKLDGAEWFARFTEETVANSGEVYLYGRTRKCREELNEDHRVVEKQSQADDAWIHHGVNAIGRAEQRNFRGRPLIQVTGIPSVKFVEELQKDNYEFFRQLPRDAILISPIKSFLAPEAYRSIYKEYVRLHRLRNDGSEILHIDGGASMEDLYDMVRYITERQDVRTVHIGGEYFAKNLYFYKDESPRRTELVFASKDVEAAELAAEFFRVPGQTEISTTDDVETVLLGGVMKNIAAYSMGISEIEELEKIYKGHDPEMWEACVHASREGENGYVTDPMQLLGRRLNWWGIYQSIAVELKGAPVTIPPEVLKDFCGCTIFNRELVAKLFREIREAYDTALATQKEEDWEVFREAVLAFRANVENFANSRNRRGGLLHAMAIFIKEKLGRPEEASLLFWDKTIEGYQAMRGLRMRLAKVARFTARHLDVGYEHFYTSNGVPKHPELDPLVPPAVRQAVMQGLHNTNFTSDYPLQVNASDLNDVLKMKWLTRTAYEFLKAELVELQDHIDNPDRDKGRVERDFLLFDRAIKTLKEGHEVRAGYQLASQLVHPYDYIFRLDGRSEQGTGTPFADYYVGVRGDQTTERVRDVSVLLSHHQARNQSSEVNIEIEIRNATRQVPSVMWAMQSVIDRFRGSQEQAINVDFVFYTPVATPRISISSNPELSRPIHWRRNYEESLEFLSDESGLPYDELEGYFEEHSGMIDGIAGADGWAALGTSAKGKYSQAFRDALQVAGPKAFLGLYRDEDQEFPDEVVVAHFDSDGKLRFYDSKIQKRLAEGSEPPDQVSSAGFQDWDAFFRGMTVDEYRVHYERVTGHSFDLIRPLKVYFPLEEILVGRSKAELSPHRLFLLLQNLGDGSQGQAFARWIEPRHFRRPDQQGFLDIRDHVIRLLANLSPST